MKLLTYLDMAKNELKNMVLQLLSSDPSSPTEGQAYWNTTAHRPKFHDGTSFKELPLSTTIANADIATGAAIALSKLATDPLARANHTGSQAASTISDFDTQVRTSRLEQLTAPNASVSFNSQKITSLADGTSANDAVNLGQLQAIQSGLDPKGSVRVATTANISLSGTQTIDGVAVIAGNRVLVKDQTSGGQNGIWVVAAGSWARATDADTDAEVTAGLFVFVEEGTTNADSGWVLTTDNAITLGTTVLTFVQFSGAGQITAGTGLSKSGNTLNVGTASTARIIVNADDIDLATAGSAGTYKSVTTDAYGRVTAGTNPTTLSGYGITDATKKYSASIGDGSTTAIAVTHSLGSKDVITQLRQNSDDSVVLADIVNTDTNTVTITFAVAPASSAIRVVVIG